MSDAESGLAPRVADDSRPEGETVAERAARVADGTFYDEDYPPCSACQEGKYFATWKGDILCESGWISTHYRRAGNGGFTQEQYAASSALCGGLPGN